MFDPAAATYMNLVHGYNSTSFQVGDVCLVGALCAWPAVSPHLTLRACAGSIVVFKDGYYMWRPQSMRDVTAEALAVLSLHHPTPSLVLVGTGQYARPLSEEVVQAYSEQGITLDVRSTVRALLTLPALSCLPLIAPPRRMLSPPSTSCCRRTAKWRCAVFPRAHE